MKYNEAIKFLYSQLPMYQRIGKKAFKKDLKNIIELNRYLGNLHELYPTIHIAGTNGKGTVAHFIAAIFQSAGYKTGLYTSPHYKDFRERIKVNGQLIPKRKVSLFVQRINRKLEDLHPSFFELSVAMSFQYFAEQKVDIAIIETGLGGRLDSTNIVNPLLSIITNISLDQQEMLGSTLEEIAYEKAGIIKAQTPVMIGTRMASTDGVFVTKAKQMNAPIYFASDIVSTEKTAIDGRTSEFLIKYKTAKTDHRLSAKLNGPWQTENLNTAIAAIRILIKYYPKYQISYNHVKRGIRNLYKLTQYQGRWQILSYKPLIVADSAHNESGLESTMNQLMDMNFNNLHIVLGFTKEKDLDKLLSYFPQNAKYYYCKANVPRGMNTSILKSKADKFKLRGKTYLSVRRALSAAKKSASKEDMIFIGGSTFIVAEVL